MWTCDLRWRSEDKWENSRTCWNGFCYGSKITTGQQRKDRNFFGELRALKSYTFGGEHVLSHRWKYYTSCTWIWHFTGCWLAGQNPGMHWIHRHNTLEVSSNYWIPETDDTHKHCTSQGLYGMCNYVHGNLDIFKEDIVTLNDTKNPTRHHEGPAVLRGWRSWKKSWNDSEWYPEKKQIVEVDIHSFIISIFQIFVFVPRQSLNPSIPPKRILTWVNYFYGTLVCNFCIFRRTLTFTHSPSFVRWKPS